MISPNRYTTEVLLSQIRIDGGTQPRVKIDLAVVADYAETFELGEDLPPVELFFDGKDYWLGDGFHRFHAARKAGLAEIAANVRTGTQRDAVLFSVGANAAHGLRRTNADKRQAVLTLLKDAEWGQWSAREIAKRCGVSNNFVSETRSSLSSDDSEDAPSEVKFTSKHGTPSTMKVPQREPKPQSAPPAPEPTPVVQAPAAPKSSFDPMEFDPDLNPALPRRSVDASKDFAGRVQQQNAMIEAFARGLVKWFDDNLPSDPWLDEARVTIARDQVRSAAATLRLSKAHTKPCPKCRGENPDCKFCRGVGYLPKASYLMAGGQ